MHFDKWGDPTDELGNPFTEGAPVADFLMEALNPDPDDQEYFQMSPGYGWTGGIDYLGIFWIVEYIVGDGSTHIEFVRIGKWFLEDKRKIYLKTVEFFKFIDKILKENKYIDDVYWKLSRKDERRFASPELMMAHDPRARRAFGG